MKQMIPGLVVIFAVIMAVIAISTNARAEDLKKATDKEIILEYQLLQSRNNELQQAIKSNNDRISILLNEAQSRPSIVGTGGINKAKQTPQAKGKKKP